ncbi:MAG: ammonium transporter [Myxococcales bacterium]|nr:ammonium transporter [Myxococcales bacterium]
MAASSIKNAAGAGLAMAATLALSGTAHASDGLDTGDTAWIIVATALVLFMTIPGLFLFYAGLLQRRNVLSMMMQCLALTCLVTVIWLAFGYSLAFDSTGMVAGQTGLHSFVGGLSKAFLSGVGPDTLSGTIPEALFFAFQLTFAIITPALMLGAFAERMKFSAVLVYSLTWLVVVYLPICHMVWGGEGAFFADMGVLDFAGGIVVHITAGVGALVACIVVGPRDGHPERSFFPHNLTMTVTGTAMLWVGWFGFNGGSALGANGGAAMAIVVTHISASVGALVWMFVEWSKNGKPSALGTATGAIAGLAAVTPASGFIGPVGGLVIGLVSGFVCYWASTTVKRKFGYDDSLDVFGVHGVGGFVGTILAGVFAAPAFGGNQAELIVGKQLMTQSIGAFGTAVYTLIASYALIKLTGALVGLRVADTEEAEGLDSVEHAERGYTL